MLKVSQVFKRAGMDYITYGLTAGDVARRGAWGVTQYRPVGMNKIIEIDQPYVTHRAMEKALKSTWEEYVALVTFDMSNETEVDFQDLPAKPKAKVSRVIKQAANSGAVDMPDGSIGMTLEVLQSSWRELKNLVSSLEGELTEDGTIEQYTVEDIQKLAALIDTIEKTSHPKYDYNKRAY